jgi:hypothetical protein
MQYDYHIEFDSLHAIEFPVAANEIKEYLVRHDTQVEIDGIPAQVIQFSMFQTIVTKNHLNCSVIMNCLLRSDWS